MKKGDLKHRGREKRRRKKVFLLIAEGKNKTEANYFTHFQCQSKDYTLKILKAGYNTDAESLYKIMHEKWNSLGLDYNEGDRGFIVIDLDNDIKKAEIIKRLMSKCNLGITFVISNPTFEIWFLLHYKYTSKEYFKCDEVVKDVKKYIEDYSKSADVYEELKNQQEYAIENAERLDRQYENEKWPSVKCNPRTDVYKLVRNLLLF